MDRAEGCFWQTVGSEGLSLLAPYTYFPPLPSSFSLLLQVLLWGHREGQWVTLPEPTLACSHLGKQPGNQLTPLSSESQVLKGRGRRRGRGRKRRRGGKRGERDGGMRKRRRRKQEEEEREKRMNPQGPPAILYKLLHTGRKGVTDVRFCLGICQRVRQPWALSASLSPPDTPEPTL